jgi:hypothetical protein
MRQSGVQGPRESARFPCGDADPLRQARKSWRFSPNKKAAAHWLRLFDDYGKRNPMAHPKAASAALNVALGRITALHLA